MKRVAALFFVAVFLPLFTSAASLDELAAQIKVLQAQIQALQQGNSLALSAPVSAVLTCDIPTKSLKRGMSGEDISRLQEFLTRDKSIYPEGSVSGYFGALTELAVQRYQIKNAIVFAGTPSTTGFGAVGPRTLALMRNTWCLHSQITPAPFTAPVGTQSSATQNPPAPPEIMFSAPLASSTVYQGSLMTISWQSQSAPQAARVILSLRNKEGVNLGTIKNDLPTSGSYFWTVPPAQAQSSSGCTADALTCLTQIADTAPCTVLCSLGSGLYQLHAELRASTKVVEAVSRVFSVGGTGLSTSDIANPGTTWDFSTSSYASHDFDAQTRGTTTPEVPCLYSGVTYTEGITLSITCADVTAPRMSCGMYGGMQLTCKAGKWVDADGFAQTVRNVTTPAGSGSCSTPWMSQVVANGSSVPYEPFFTAGQYLSTGPMKLMKCNGGAWQTCDTAGANCR